MKTLIVILSLVFVLGCSNPYKAQFEALQTSYQQGEISANDYFSRLNELQALDLQQRQALAQAFSQAGRQLGNAADKVNQPSYYPAYAPATPSVTWISRESRRRGAGTLTTPGGQSYQYNYQEY